MKYKNAANVLPEDLLGIIQQYVQGEYIYIPIKEKIEKAMPTKYKVELQKRDENIYTKHLEGVSNRKLSHMYHLSESSIRRIIINQRKCYKDMEGRIKNILKNWCVELREITQIYDTAWQVDEKYILKVYDDVNMLERNIKMISILDTMRIPVGKIVPTKKRVAFAKDKQYYYVLSEKLHGNNIVNIKDNPDMAFQMGKILAELHLAFKECEMQDEFWNNSLLSEMKGWIREILQDGGWQFIDEDRFNTIVVHLERLYEKLPVQLIHRDVHFGNFLFDEGEFSGYIDFDLSQRNIRIFDLCYFVLGLLSEEEKLEITETDWFEILRNLFVGYQKKIELLGEERQAVPYVMQSIELLFIAWFSGQDDVKCAEDAMKILNFVDANTDKIIEMINF